MRAPLFFKTMMFRRLFSLFVLVVVIPVLLIGVVTYNLRLQSYEENAARYLNDVAVMRARQMDFLNQQNLLSIGLVAINPVTKLLAARPADNQARADAVAQLRKGLALLPALHTVVMTFGDGGVVKVGYRPRPETIKEISLVADDGVPVAGPVIFRALSSRSGELLLESRVPVVSDSGEVATLEFYWDVGRLSIDLANGLEMYQTAELTSWLKDMNGQVRPLWAADMLAENFGRDVVAAPDHPASVTVAQGRLYDMRFVDEKGLSRYAGSAKTDIGWVVLVTVSEAEIVGNLLTSFVVAFGTSIGLLFLALWYMIRQLGIQFLTLTDLLRHAVASAGLNMPDEDLTKSQGWNLRRDELTVAIDYVGHMVERLRERNIGLEDELQQRTIALTAAQKNLAEVGSSERIMQMSSVLTHEINQPLGNISILVEDWLAAPEELNAVDGLADDLQLILKMVTQIRQISKNIRGLGRQHASADVTAISIGEALAEARLLALPSLQENQVMLEVTDATDLPLVAANETSLQQVFSNLLQNASKAMADCPVRRISIAAFKDPQDSRMVIIEVADTGTGIPAEILPNIFSPGVSSRLDSDGAGLGLAIVRRIMETCGGHIAISKTGPDGTVVRLALPVWSQDVVG